MPVTEHCVTETIPLPGLKASSQRGWIRNPDNWNYRLLFPYTKIYGEENIINNLKPMKMNNNSTLERMKELKLLGMLLCFSTSLKTGEHEHITADELLAILIEAEYDYRRTKHINVAFDRAQ